MFDGIESDWGGDRQPTPPEDPHDMPPFPWWIWCAMWAAVLWFVRGL